MGKKKKEPLSFVEIMRKLAKAGMENPQSPNRVTNSIDNLDTLEDRIKVLLNIVERDKRPAKYMIFFVMYDIESTKVRNQVAKYLLKNGCVRVQKSIFLADLPLNTYEKIRNDLAEVQQAYENNDSILIVPISTDLLTSMRVIGQTIDIQLITKNKNTLFY